MSDLVRSIIKWILVALLAFLVIFLIVKLATRKNVVEGNAITPISTTEKEEESATTKEETKQEETKNETKDNETSTLIVDAADTATTRGISGLIGIIMLGATTYYIIKSQQPENE